MILSILLAPTLFVVILFGIVAIVGVLIVAATIYCGGHKKGMK